jgi:hypothetical protein
VRILLTKKRFSGFRILDSFYSSKSPWRVLSKRDLNNTKNKAFLVYSIRFTPLWALEGYYLNATLIILIIKLSWFTRFVLLLYEPLNGTI